MSAGLRAAGVKQEALPEYSLVMKVYGSDVGDVYLGSYRFVVERRLNCNSGSAVKEVVGSGASEVGYSIMSM